MYPQKYRQIFQFSFMIQQQYSAAHLSVGGLHFFQNYFMALVPLSKGKKRYA